MCVQTKGLPHHMYLYSSVCEISSHMLRSFFAGVAKILRTPLMFFLLLFGLFFTKNTIIFLVKFLFIVRAGIAAFAHNLKTNTGSYLKPPFILLNLSFNVSFKTKPSSAQTLKVCSSKSLNVLTLAILIIICPLSDKHSLQFLTVCLKKPLIQDS